MWVFFFPDSRGAVPVQWVTGFIHNAGGLLDAAFVLNGSEKKKIPQSSSQPFSISFARPGGLRRCISPIPDSDPAGQDSLYSTTETLITVM